MTLLLRWRIPAPAIVTRWRGPAGMMTAVTRNPTRPIAAIVGPPGPAGSAEAVPIIVAAGEDIGGHRAVTFDALGQAILADHRTLIAGAALAVSTQAAEEGAEIAVQASGVLEEPGWNWVPGPIYVGQAGVLTQSPPTSGLLVPPRDARRPRARG